MNSAVGSVLGLSMLLAAATGCDNGGEEEAAADGPKAVGGSSSSGGAPATGGSTATSGGSAPLAEGVPLTAADGWVDMGGNTLGIQGAMFAYADPTSSASLEENFLGANACIKGEVAKVDLKCTPVLPATDCYGEFWGAAIGLNLNQPIDPVTLKGVNPPLPYDASALTGFAFEITGTTVPLSLRFKAENASGEFCSLPAKPIKAGANTVLFSDLTTECWAPTPTSRKGDTAKSSITKIAWQVVTNDSSTVPFDYCVANVRALQ